MLRHRPELHDKPVVLLADTSAKATVVQLTGEARRAVVHTGMTATQALARCADVTVLPRSTQAENSAQEALLQCAFNFSPFVEATAEGVCTLDLRGSEIQQRFSEIDGWSRKVVGATALLGLRSQIGVAATPDLALLAARFARPIFHLTNADDFTRDLPVASLDPSPQVAGILKRWGIHTVGQLVALGKENVAERLGPEALLLFKRAAPTEIRPLKMAFPPEVFAEAMEFQNEVETLEPLLFILRRFIEQLSRRIEMSYRVIRELKLTLMLSSQTEYERTFHVPSPTRNVETLFRMVFAHLENVTTESAIVGLRLEAIPAHEDNHQFALFETSLRDPNHFFETIARLTAVLGPERVGTPVMGGSYRADDFKMERVKFQELETEHLARKRKKTAARACSIKYGLALRRIRPPLPAEVELREERPVYLSSARIRGKIEQAAGPWRTSGSWWEREWLRDEWDIQTAAGRLCRIYEQQGQWFLEGVFD